MLRYFEIVFSIVVVVLSFPYVFRVPPNLVASSKYHDRPDGAKNAYFVLSMLFGFLMVRLVLSSPSPIALVASQSLDPSAPSTFLDSN